MTFLGLIEWHFTLPELNSFSLQIQKLRWIWLKYCSTVHKNSKNENFSHRISKIDYITNISKTSAMTFLGIQFDPNLNFKYHIKQLSSNLSRALYMYYAFRKKYFCSICAENNLLFSLSLPHYICYSVMELHEHQF